MRNLLNWEKEDAVYDKIIEALDELSEPKVGLEKIIPAHLSVLLVIAYILAFYLRNILYVLDHKE